MSHTIRFTDTTKRAKFRNLQVNPGMALCILDPQGPYRFLEVRGRLVEAKIGRASCRERV